MARRCLKGVTGSGKTEVYLEAVAECLAQNRQALVLLPEIALTAEFLTRVEARFGAKPAEWHSGVTMTERRRVWRMVGEGGAQMVIGARSALFLPFRDLGLIVVDEEHDTSYKQEDGVVYSARDMAVLRASINGAQVILASATPSLESWANAEAGKYEKLELTSRFGDAELPQMAAIDMRNETLPGNRWISPTLQAEVTKRIERKEQSLLFLNRRGYAPVTICRACGHQIGCDHCDARMVEHRFLKRLVCHQCGETKPMPTKCPHCEAEDRLAPVGPGVERLAEEVTALFPDARVAVLSSDLYGSARALKEQIVAIAQGAADIIIGTQLVAKGHNFPLLTLVGVIDADLGLQGSDLRAAERTFQLMRQVAGRAGRTSNKGVALLQTYQPEHPVIRAILAGDEEGFWRAEAAERQAAGVPPYGRLAGIILSSPNVQEVFDLGTEMSRRDAPLRARSARRSSAPPRPPSPASVAATGCGCWSRPTNPRRCNPHCKNGSPSSDCPPTCACKSTSTRRVSTNQVRAIACANIDGAKNDMLGQCRTEAGMESLNIGRAFTLIEPGPVVLVTTNDGQKNNVMTISWTMVLDFAAGFAITTGPWNHSFAALQQSTRVRDLNPDGGPDRYSRRRRNMLWQRHRQV